MAVGATLDRNETMSAAGRPATRVETWLVVAGGVWLLLGLFIDGYAHSEIIDTETEDFFTPWHAIFYSGFAASAAAIGWMASRRLEPGGSLLRGSFRVLPPAYRWAAVGLIVFAVGGIGDGIWHTVFGVETSLDALLSPTHLVLLCGLLLILSAPLGAAWRSPRSEPSWRALGAPLVSATLVLSLIVFFMNYVFGLTEAWQLEVPYFPENDGNGATIAYGLAMTYLATVVLVAAAVALLRRWRLPRGAIVALWASPVLMVTAAFGGSWLGLPAAMIGAATVELVVALLAPRLARSWSTVVALGIGTFAMWAAWILLASREFEIVWQAELWTGLIAMNTLVAAGLALVACAPTPEMSGDVSRASD